MYVIYFVKTNCRPNCVYPKLINILIKKSNVFLKHKTQAVYHLSVIEQALLIL